MKIKKSQIVMLGTVFHITLILVCGLFLVCLALFQWSFIKNRETVEMRFGVY